MKKGDFVKVKRMPRKFKRNSIFGVLFVGLTGEVYSSRKDGFGAEVTLVTFTSKNNEYNTISLHFYAKELRKVGEKPTCHNLKEPTRGIKEIL